MFVRLFQLSWSETRHVESAAIEAVLAMVVRLSENTFRPMFYKVRAYLQITCCQSCFLPSLRHFLPPSFPTSLLRPFTPPSFHTSLLRPFPPPSFPHFLPPYLPNSLSLPVPPYPFSTSSPVPEYLPTSLLPYIPPSLHPPSFFLPSAIIHHCVLC